MLKRQSFEAPLPPPSLNQDVHVGGSVTYPRQPGGLLLAFLLLLLLLLFQMMTMTMGTLIIHLLMLAAAIHLLSQAMVHSFHPLVYLLHPTVTMTMMTTALEQTIKSVQACQSLRAFLYEACPILAESPQQAGPHFCSHSHTETVPVHLPRQTERLSRLGTQPRRNGRTAPPAPPPCGPFSLGYRARRRQGTARRLRPCGPALLRCRVRCRRVCSVRRRPRRSEPGTAQCPRGHCPPPALAAII